MLRNSMIGLVTFGIMAALAGFVWVAYEFPFAIVVPAAVGWYAVTRTSYGNRKALWAGLVGGVTFTAAFMSAMVLALSDGSPFALSAWGVSTLAAAIAGAVTGALLGRGRGALVLAVFSGAGMAVAATVAGALGQIAPAGTDVPGMIQSGYFAFVQGVVGAIVGAAAGAAVAWLAEHPAHSRADSGGALPAS